MSAWLSFRLQSSMGWEYVCHLNILSDVGRSFGWSSKIATRCNFVLLFCEYGETMAASACRGSHPAGGQRGATGVTNKIQSIRLYRNVENMHRPYERLD
eukprot:5416597-Pleurochrysis_carterae.AAC.2